MTAEIDLKELLQLLLKKIWWILASVILVTAAAGVISYSVLSPVYEASTKLIVNNSQQMSNQQQLDINDLNFNIRLINTYKEVIRTHAIMDSVAEKHPEFGLTGEELIGKIQVSAVNDSQVMTLSVQDISYAKAANIVNAVSEEFRERIPSIMKVDNVSILNEADLQRQPGPVKPNPTLNMAIAFVLALLASCGIILLLEYLDDRVRTEKDVLELLDWPVLAKVTRVEEEDMKKSRRHSIQHVQAGEQTGV